MLFKILTAEGKPAHGGTGSYSLPHDGQPGEWMPVVDVKACFRGYHLTTRPDHWWTRGARVFLAEPRGAADVMGNKVACASVRLHQEITTQWSLLPAFPILMAMMAQEWRRDHPDEEWPAWADLRGADLRDANLQDADLQDADLRGANLQDAELRGANLGGANLQDADLRGADLQDADLRGADLQDADLRGADLPK